MSSSYDRNIDRLRQSERQATQQGINQRNEMASTMGQRSITEAAQLADTLKDFSGTLKEFHEYHKEEQAKIGLREYKQFKKVNAEKYLELEKQIENAKGNQKEIEKLRRRQIDLKGVNGYVDAERISHLSDYAQVAFIKAQLQTVKETFAPKLQDAMQNSDKELSIVGSDGQAIKFTTKDIHANNTDPLEFKRAGIEAHADSIWKNSGLDRYSPEMLEYAGVTKAFDDAKESLNRKYTQRYNIEKSSKHREKHEKIFDTIIEEKKDPTGADLELLYRGVLSTFDGEENPMTKAGTWKVLNSKLVSAALASNEDPEKYLTRILGQEIPESWAKELGVPKGTTFDQHWKNKVSTLTAEANKIRNDQIDAEKRTEDNWLVDQENAFKARRREGNISEEEIRDKWVPIWTARGLEIPESIKTYQTLYDRNAAKDRTTIEREMKLNPENVTERWLEQFHPESKDLEGLQDLVKKNRENITTEIEEDAEDLLNEVLEDMNLKGNEKTSTYGHSKELITKAAIKKYYENVDKGMPKDIAYDQALNGPDGILTEVEKNRDRSKYVMNPRSKKAKAILAKEFADAKLNLKEIRNAKIELQHGPPKMWQNEHIGGDYGKAMINEIITNLNDEKYFGKPWLALAKSKNALEYYNGVYRGLNPTANGIYDLLDAQLKLNGYKSGFYKGELEMAKENNAYKEEIDNSEEKKTIPVNPIKELSNLNHNADNNPTFSDKEGYSFVWKDVLKTLNFEGIDHYLEAITQMSDSVTGDTGFWDFEDNLSFINDDELFGEYTLND